MPAYLRKPVISFDPDVEIKKWKKGWIDSETKEKVGGYQILEA